MEVAFRSVMPKGGWICLAAGLLSCAAMAAAEIVPVELDLTTPGVYNRLDLTMTATINGVARSDSDVTDLSGTIRTKLTASFDPVTQQVQAVSGLEFDGGRIGLTDVSFVLNFFPLGTVVANGTGMAATVDTPDPPGPVTGETFATDPHEVIFNEGTNHAYGTGMLTGVVDVNFDLAESPITVTSQTTGTLQLALSTQTATTATYTADLILPANFVLVLRDDPENQVLIEMYTVGTIRATGRYTRCLLEADLTGDCRVDLADLEVLAGQWLAAGPPADCALTADLSGGDCRVDLRDFAVLAGQWLAGLP